MLYNIPKAAFLGLAFAISAFDSTLSWLLQNEALAEIALASWVAFLLGFLLKDPD